MRVSTATRAVPFSPPDVSEAEIGAVEAVLRSGWLTTGPRVAEFEERFAAFTGAAHAVAVSSCTAALELSLLVSEIGPGDEVVTTPLTFCSTANAIVHRGATPVFADVDPATGNLDPAAAAAAISPATRVLLPVHYAGLPVNLCTFEALAGRAGLLLVADAAHCVEGMSGGHRMGAAGDFSCFSFYATKNLTTGEGGMVTTRTAEAAARVRVASRHGLTSNAWTRDAGGGRTAYDMVMPGLKANMTDLQAALGLQQLARLPAMHRRREAICRRYDDGLAGLPIRVGGTPPPGTVHARHLYTVRVRAQDAGVSRDGLQARLRDRGVATSVHFPAVHLLSYYRQRFGFRRGMFPAAEAVADETLSLPLSSALDDGDVDRVIEALHDALG
jgi:dTDP-4-amino-4,6-dideoxygalactose transaminase